MSVAFEAAGVGHRITHDGLEPAIERMQGPALSKKLALKGSMPSGGVLGVVLMKADMALEKQGASAACPGPTGAIARGSPDVFLGPGKRAAARLDGETKVACDDHADGPLVTGAATVVVNGSPLARRTDALDCGALVGEGESTILVGGPATDAPTKKKPPLGAGGALLALMGAETAPSLGPALGKVLARAAPSAPKAMSPTAAGYGQLVAHDEIGALGQILSGDLSLRP